MRVTQQGKGYVVGSDKRLMRRLGVRRNPNNDRIQCLKLTIQVTEAFGFLGSPGSVVFGVKIKNHMFVFKILQRDLVAFCIRQRECRCWLAFLNCH